MGDFELKIDTPLQQLLARTRVSFQARASTYLITYKTEVMGFDFIYKATHKYEHELDLSKYDKMYQQAYDNFVARF